MSLNRDIGITVPAMIDTVFVTCAAILSTAASTSPALNMTATADAVVAPTAGTLTTAYGRVIDRLGPPLGTIFDVALPSAKFNASRGSTEANRQIVIGVKLQHGDSSGGGDMADYSTGSQPDDRTYFGTSRTTDMLNWQSGGLSTGALNATSNAASYDLRAAKQFIRVAVRIGKNRVTTESSGDEQGRVSASLTLLAGRQAPQPIDPSKSPYSTTTATA